MSGSYEPDLKLLLKLGHRLDDKPRKSWAEIYRHIRCEVAEAVRQRCSTRIVFNVRDIADSKSMVNLDEPTI